MWGLLAPGCPLCEARSADPAASIPLWEGILRRPFLLCAFATNFVTGGVAAIAQTRPEGGT
jgi:hypothetical protein